mmetsp:Transcript_8534/g.16704  ORF Transcript_8534/g.16704 Transcript_8534/m.16704 type:complete len:288 (+) Transcript_8534:681-1544(+)
MMRKESSDGTSLERAELMDVVVLREQMNVRGRNAPSNLCRHQERFPRGILRCAEVVCDCPSRFLQRREGEGENEQRHSRQPTRIFSQVIQSARGGVVDLKGREVVDWVDQNNSKNRYSLLERRLCRQNRQFAPTRVSQKEYALPRTPGWCHWDIQQGGRHRTLPVDQLHRLYRRPSGRQRPRPIPTPQHFLKHQLRPLPSRLRVVRVSRVCYHCTIKPQIRQKPHVRHVLASRHFEPARHDRNPPTTPAAPGGAHRRGPGEGRVPHPTGKGGRHAHCHCAETAAYRG